MCRLRLRYALWVCASLLISVVANGCARPNDGDRAINWSREGQAVGFQHGLDGVFLAARNGAELRKIFKPDDDVVATSAPLWSPTDGRVIFTTARSLSSTAGLQASEKVAYTCRLRAEGTGAVQPVPTSLFEERCSLDYVWSSMAVRWHPSGTRILFIRRVDGFRHGLFEYDLLTKRMRQIFPYIGEALSFDWAPDGKNLVCVVGGKGTDRDTAGLWIGRPGRDDWWHVPTNEDFSGAGSLERVGTSQPAWAADGQRFAVAARSPHATLGHAGPDRILLGSLQQRRIREWLHEPAQFSDLHWSPDGKYVGFIRQENNSGRENSSDRPWQAWLNMLARLRQPPSELRLVAVDAAGPALARREDARRFLGWDGRGKKFAFVGPDRVRSPGYQWALLLVADLPPRDRVYVGHGMDLRSAASVFSGMRVTVPQWSPREDKLSLWVVFQPTYRFTLSVIFDSGLPPGDPAAILDLKTGQLSWLAVNADERAQVGHFHLLRRNYAEAWRWYQRAEQQAPLDLRARFTIPTHPESRFSGMALPLFEYVCLDKLGRPDDARCALARFQKTLAEPPMPASARLLGTLMQDFFIAEVFLAIDASADGVKFLQDSMNQSADDSLRPVHAVVLGQFLLLQHRYQEYARLMEEQVIPFVGRMGTRAEKDPTASSDAEFVSALAQVGLAPLLVPEFLAELSDADIQELIARWQISAIGSAGGAQRPESQLGLYAAYWRLGRLQQARDIENRFNKADASATSVFGKGTVNSIIQDIRNTAERQ